MTTLEVFEAALDTPEAVRRMVVASKYDFNSTEALLSVNMDRETFSREFCDKGSPTVTPAQIMLDLAEATPGSR